MPDVSRVTGPTGPKEPDKDKHIADAQKFKELMKIQKVGEVDEDQKKKRKRKDEAEAEQKADTEEAQSTQTRAKTPLEGGPPLKAFKSGAPTAPTQAEPPAPPALPPQQPEPHFMEDESFLSSLPSVDLSTRKGADDQADQKSTAGTEREKEPSSDEKSADEARIKARESSKEAEQRAKEKAAELKKKQEEEAASQTGASTVQPPILEGKKGEKEKKIEEVAGAASSLGPTSTPLGTTPATPTAPAPYTQLHPMVLDLFERMVGVMTVMSTSGITETTVTLSSPQYANSVFFGAQIVIREYSTAPKAFNIQIISNPQGLSLIQANTPDLLASFQTGKYNFRVNRLEATLSTEKPLFKRKEAIDRDKEEKSEK